MPRILQWFNNQGAVVFRASDSFSRTAERVLDSLFPHSSRHHMRVGKFSTVVVAGDLIAAPFYEDKDSVPNDIMPDSEYWESHKSDRLSQLNRIARTLRSTHPHAVAIRQAIADERAEFEVAEVAYKSQGGLKCPRTRAEVDRDIQAIFKKHRVRPDPGLEGFWNAVEDVAKKSEADARNLNELSFEWEDADVQMHKDATALIKERSARRTRK